MPLRMTPKGMAVGLNGRFIGEVNRDGVAVFQEAPLTIDSSPMITVGEREMRKIGPQKASGKRKC